jgi:hypothetical protein
VEEGEGASFSCFSPYHFSSSSPFFSLSEVQRFCQSTSTLQRRVLPPGEVASSFDCVVACSFSSSPLPALPTANGGVRAPTSTQVSDVPSLISPIFPHLHSLHPLTQLISVDLPPTRQSLPLLLLPRTSSRRCPSARAPQLRGLVCTLLLTVLRLRLPRSFSILLRLGPFRSRQRLQWRRRCHAKRAGCAGRDSVEVLSLLNSGIRHLLLFSGAPASRSSSLFSHLRKRRSRSVLAGLAVAQARLRCQQVEPFPSARLHEGRGSHSRTMSSACGARARQR